MQLVTDVTNLCGFFCVFDHFRKVMLEEKICKVKNSQNDCLKNWAFIKGFHIEKEQKQPFKTGFDLRQAKIGKVIAFKILISKKSSLC